MKKYYFLIIVALILGLVLTGCSLLSNVGQVPATEQSGMSYLTKGTPGYHDVFTLYAGQHIDVGTVSVWNDDSNLYVEYITTSVWKMTETHLYVGKTNPEELTSAPGQFPYSEEHNPAVIAYTYTIPIDDIDSYSLSKKGKKWVADNDIGIGTGDLIYIAAHAEASDGNILNNPGAETGDMSGWSFIGPVRAIGFRHESTGDVFPRSGDYFFDMTASPAGYAEMSQELSVAGYDGVSFIANCWIQTELYPDPENANIIYNDYGELVLTFKDGSSAVLGIFTTGPIGNPVPGAGTTGYAQFDLTGNIPSGAVTVIYTLKGFLVGGGYVNVFYDDLSFEYWQEETAWADGELFSEQGNWATYITYDPAVLIDTVTVGSDGVVCPSSAILETGKKYRLEASGEYTYNSAGDWADAEWYLKSGTIVKGDTEGSKPYVLDISIDGYSLNRDWGDYKPDHIYSMLFDGTGSTIDFSIYDSYSGDNIGSLTVDIYWIP